MVTVWLYLIIESKKNVLGLAIKKFYEKIIALKSISLLQRWQLIAYLRKFVSYKTPMFDLVRDTSHQNSHY